MIAILLPPLSISFIFDIAVIRKSICPSLVAGSPAPNLPPKQVLLFLMTAISKMKDIDKGGSRIAIIHNGSPLFTGDAGSGPSEIRRYILENDLLEANSKHQM